MKASTASTVVSPLPVVIFGILAGLLVLGVLTGRKLPLIANDKTALIVLLVLGIAMCAPGIGRVAQAGAWAQPLSILAYLLGALILLVGAAGIFGFKLPLVTDPRSAIIAVSGLAVVKLVLSAIHDIWL